MKTHKIINTGQSETFKLKCKNKIIKNITIKDKYIIDEVVWNLRFDR